MDASQLKALPTISRQVGLFQTFRLVVFTPSFFYILVGGPFILWLRRVAALQRALRAVSAAVVGVMAGFAVWFAGNALFPAARQGHFNGWVLVMAAAALMALVRFRVGVGALLAACAVGGVIVSLLP